MKMITVASFALSLLFNINVCIVSAQMINETEKPPNIVLILTDDMGFSDIGCYGGEINTPNLDSIAANGIRFTQFYNTARCWTTRASILSGYYAQQVNIGYPARAAFPRWGHLIPHHLKQAGYRSYHSGKWHIDNVKRKLSDGGFDRSFDCTQGEDHHLVMMPEYLFLDDRKLSEIAMDMDVKSEYYSTSVITDFSIEFLEEHFKDFKNSPFFLYVAYLAPHFPLQAPQEDIDKYRERYLSGWEVLKEERYNRQLSMGYELGRNSPFEYYVTSPYSWQEEMIRDTIPDEIHLSRPWEHLTENEKYLQATKMAVHAAMVEGIDREVGRLMKYIESIGEDKNTLFLFLSDNGADATVLVRGNGHDSNASLGSADSYLCLGPGFSSASNTPFRRHKVWVHEGGISTPLIAYWPQGIKAKGEFRNNMGHVIDFLPTFLEIAGVEPLMEKNGFTAPELPGQSLVSIFHEDKTDDRELYFSHVGNRALRQGKWKAVYSPYNDGKWQLYDMHIDRTELNDLSSPYPESLRNISPRWNRFRKQDILDDMISRWEKLDELYLNQGKVGL